MPGFEPFAGVRYDPSVPLDSVVAPPYDVVGPRERAELAVRHRANAIHVELPAGDPEEGLDRYTHAARLLAAWIDEGILLQDAAPVFYAYRMTTSSGSTSGVIGALACEPIGGDILPHEQTIPKDRSDRLDLLRATRTNTSPIWGLSLTEGLSLLYQQNEPADAAATDDEGVLHELWVIDDAATIDAIRVSVASSPIVIADGHHRYETALAYQAERRAARDGLRGDYDLVMALVVELAPDQLTVGPIHRMLKGVPDDEEAMLAAFRQWFDVVHAGAADEQLVTAIVDSQAVALVGRKDVWLLTPREGAYEAAGSDLDSSLVASAVDAMAGVAVAYNHDWRTVISAVMDGEADAAVLMRPVSVVQIGEWARTRRRMPPKSTYFHPKPRTGMVFRQVQD
ncbi:MAG TPA: DUF1015 domain-containing protein [Acidimicrobiales bacterium]|nr:DUF1015 domain-containing protein [Acidimicrobiales bacterium]